MSDALLSRPTSGYFDFSIAENGDVVQVDFFDTAIMVSIYEEKRASSSEVALPELRRGWIGNESTPDFERGSKIWLYYQSRLTRDVINSIISAADESLGWLISQNFAIAVQSDIIIRNGAVFLIVQIQRPDSTTISRELFLWDNSGVTEAAA
jgi:phage gp46-like protein